MRDHDVIDCHSSRLIIHAIPRPEWPGVITSRSYSSSSVNPNFLGTAALALFARSIEILTVLTSRAESNAALVRIFAASVA